MYTDTEGMLMTLIFAIASAKSLSAELLFLLHDRFEPSHEKTNKMTVRPAKTQISLGIHPV